MQYGIITVLTEYKVTDYRSDTEFTGAEHKTYNNSYKPAEGCFAGKTRFITNKVFHHSLLNKQ